MRCWTLVLLVVPLAMYYRASGQGSGAPDQGLHNLFAAEWDYDMQQAPEHASSLGDRRWNDRWSDESLEAYARRNQHYQEVLARLAKIDRNQLSPADQLNFDLFQKRYQDRVEGYKFHWFPDELQSARGYSNSRRAGRRSSLPNLEGL